MSAMDLGYGTVEALALNDGLSRRNNIIGAGTNVRMKRVHKGREAGPEALVLRPAP